MRMMIYHLRTRPPSQLSPFPFVSFFATFSLLNNKKSDLRSALKSFHVLPLDKNLFLFLFRNLRKITERERVVNHTNKNSET